MEWLNIKTSTLRSAEYLGSKPVERATWINVLAYSVDQENGGLIAGAALWKDRQWQQCCGVTAREVREASKLLSRVGDDIRVFGYPTDKQAEVQARRIQATDAARRRWQSKLGITEPELTGNAPRTPPRNASRIPPRNAEGEVEREGESSGGVPHPPNPTTPPRLLAESDFPNLATRFPGVSIATEAKIAARYVLEKRGPHAPLEYEFFIRDWLPRAPVRGYLGSAAPTAASDPLPIGFAEWFDREYPDADVAIRSTYLSTAWHSLPTTLREKFESSTRKAS